jgi:hypothetical protein
MRTRLRSPFSKSERKIYVIYQVLKKNIELLKHQTI